VEALLEPSPDRRLGAAGLEAVYAHPFFASMPDLDTLHSQATPPPYAAGSVRPRKAAAWAKRQNSVLWLRSDRAAAAAQPRSTADGDAGGASSSGADEVGLSGRAIPETPLERSVPFAAAPAGGAHHAPPPPPPKASRLARGSAAADAAVNNLAPLTEGAGQEEEDEEEMEER